MKKVLVTGCTGLLGNNIVRQLLESGYEVTAAVRNSSPTEPLSDLTVKVVEVDFDDESSIERSLEGIDAVIHSAGFIWFGWSKLKQSRKVNVQITSRIAKACVDQGIRFVHVSSLDALPAARKGEVVDEDALQDESKWVPKVPCNYVVSKREADRVVEGFFEKGLHGCIVHPGLMLGPYDWKPSSGELIQAVCKLGLWFSCPTGGISVTDVRDVADATIRAAEDRSIDNRHFILAGHNVSYRDLCNRIADKCGVLRPRGRTGPVAIGLATLVGSISSMFGNESMANSATVRMARLWHHYSSERAISELGYKIRTLDGILDDAIEWLGQRQMIKLPKRN